MNSEYCLPRHYMNVPLKDIRCSAKTQIGDLLNDVESSVIESNSGLINNYYGLAELVGFSNEQIQFISSKENPTSSLFHLWEGSTDLEPKLGKLWEYLTELKRFDVMNECRKAIDRDVRNYQKTLNSCASLQAMQVPPRDDHDVDETRVLTTGDVENKSPQFYDAFVCYNFESEHDVQFVHQLKTKLEDERGLKLCIPGRDNLPGATEYVTDAALIKSRCRMMIIVLSNAYLESSACDFQVKIAHALSPCTQKKRMIPVLTEPMAIPDVLHHMSICDFTKKGLLKWAWERLVKSLRKPVDNQWSDNHWWGDVRRRNPSQADNADFQDTTRTVSEDSQNDLNSNGISTGDFPPRLSPMNIVSTDNLCNFPDTQTVRHCQCDDKNNSPSKIQFNNAKNFVQYNVGRCSYDHNSNHSGEPSNHQSSNSRLQTRGLTNSRYLSNENEKEQNNQNNRALTSFASSIRDKFPDISDIIENEKKQNNQNNRALTSFARSIRDKFPDISDIIKKTKKIKNLRY